MGLRLDPAKGPPALRPLIPPAERFGITDDIDRENLVLASSPQEIAELKASVEQHDDEFDQWLAGPEADGPEFSEESLAFTAMRMGADFAYPRRAADPARVGSWYHQGPLGRPVR